MGKFDMNVDRERAKQVADYMIDPDHATLSNRELGRRLGMSESYIRRAKAMFPSGPTMTMKIADLKMDAATQPRDEINPVAVEEYAADMKAGAKFPPVTVYYDGTNYWLADGYHRVQAAISVKQMEIEADVRMGNLRDAILHAVGANAAHGLRRTNADKRRAAETLLRDEEWSQWSNRKIGEWSGVDKNTVAAYRSGLSSTGEIPQLGATKGADGKVRDTSKIAESNSSRSGSKSGGTPAPATASTATEPTPRTREPGDDDGPTTDDAPPANGQSKVNGVLAPDPPDIAALRAAGKIPPGVVPDVSEPEAGTAEAAKASKEPIKADLTDEEWLATLPLYSALENVARKIFAEDALVYRHLETAKAAFRYVATREMNATGRRGAYAYFTARYLKLDHPKDWVRCAATEYGGCGGSGQVVLIGECPKCHGRGYWIK